MNVIEKDVDEIKSDILKVMKKGGKVQIGTVRPKDIFCALKELKKEKPDWTYKVNNYR